MEDLIEKLADVEHERWSGWMKYLFTKGDFGPGGDFIIEPESVEHWMNLMYTSYADLPEHSKESDRKEVRKTLKVIGEQLLEHD